MPTRWQAIAQALAERIRAGDPPVGALLPGEHALSAAFGASRITLRRALAELEQRGMVSRRRGAGTRVEATAARDLYVHDASGVDEVLRFTADLSFRLLSRQRAPADAATAREFSVAPGTEMVTLRALRCGGGGLPVCLSVHRLPARLATAAEPLDEFRGSLATRLARAAGESVEAIRQSLEAVALPAEDAGTLQAPPGGAALLTRRVYLGRAGRLLLASRSLFPAGRYVHTASLRRAGLPDLGETT
jgi:DNA-binding GntR family transcriptional regulator